MGTIILMGIYIAVTIAFRLTLYYVRKVLVVGEYPDDNMEHTIGPVEIISASSSKGEYV